MDDSARAEDDQPDRHLIACNYLTDTGIASRGALAYVIPQLGGNLPDRVRVLVKSRGSRWVEKWEAVAYLGNFRLKTIPAEHPRYADERVWDGTQEQVDELNGIISGRD